MSFWEKKKDVKGTFCREVHRTEGSESTLGTKSLVGWLPWTEEGGSDCPRQASCLCAFAGLSIPTVTPPHSLQLSTRKCILSE